MAYYPDVHPGDDVENSAERENDIRHLLNNSNGFRDGFNRAKLNSVRIPVWNLTPYTINAGALVYVVVTSDMCGDAFPVAPLNYNPYDPQFLYDDAPFGVLEKTLKAKDTGSLVLSGTVEVSITAGTSGNFAKPVPTGGFERGREGFRILHLNGAGTSAIILVGDYRMPDYQAGDGINHALLSGGTISTNLVPGTDISITSVTGSTNGELSISYTGSGGGGGSEFYVPAYNRLSLGVLPEHSYGHATTFIVRVKAGTVGFWDEGGGAACVYTDITGSTSYTLTNKQDYVAQADGYLRISVYDDGSTPGECLSFYSPTGGVPLYKYGFMVSGIVASVSGGTAFVGLTGGTGSVRFIGENITISGNTNGEIVLKGETGGGIGYPDYIALAGGTASNALGEITDDDYDGTIPPAPTIPQNPILGITHIIPVPANAPIKYYSSFACLVRFAPEAGGTGHFYYDLSNEMEWTPNCNGWLRISILDDGSHASDCIRLYVGGEDWSDAVAMHKCAKLTSTGVTGITSSVSGGTAFITPVNGTGSVRFRGVNITISGNTNGEIVLTGSTSGGGGGGGFFPAWSTTGHTDVIPITDGSGQGYTANADGWLFACAFFDPLEDRLKYKNYDAHVVVGDARMKIAELKLPGGTPFIKVGNVKYTRDANNDWSWDPYVEHPYYSYFAWKDNNDTTIYTSNVAPVVGESTYTYDSEEEDFIDNEAEVEETNTATYAVCIGSGSPIPVKSGAVIKFVVLADGYTFYSRRTPPPCFCVFYSSNPPSTP